MKEVSGRTLGEVIREVHAASRESWSEAPSGWSLRRLVDALARVADALAYAHARGVVHRDLKPANVMVGEHGEVLVLDWGIAKVMGRAAATPVFGDGDAPVQTGSSVEASHPTMVGAVAGTPAYMAPEQAFGDIAHISPATDVYALGAMLREVLSGRPPYTGETAMDILAQVRAGPPAPLGAGEGPLPSWDDARSTAEEDGGGPVGPSLPAPLVALCARAMARAPEARVPGAAAMAAELRAWLDGARRREDALALVAAAAEQGPEAAALRARAAALRAAASAALAAVQPWRPESDKAAGWALEDEALGLERAAELASIREEQLLQGALTHAPDLAEAHAALAARYRAEHEAAERGRGDPSRPEALLRQHLAALPAAHPVRRSHLRYLRGDGALSLVTDPPGAEVWLHRYTVRGRRLVPEPVGLLGHTPLTAVPLPMGSYLCVLRHPARAEVQYPVFIGREHHWDGVPPNSAAPTPVRLPRRAELGPDDCYVPPGWFWAGGDALARDSLPGGRLWLDGFVLRRHPVVNRSYIAFLDALVAEGRVDEALRHAPRERGGTAGEQGPLIYGFDGTRFSLRPDADGDAWDPDFPVLMVDWYGAEAFAAWEAARTGQPWRLPVEREWEKAARGVDGRAYPWGDGFDPSFACMKDSHERRRIPAVVQAFPVDCSPFGLRGMAGNAVDWCADAVYRTDAAAGAAGAPRDGLGSYRVIRGGCWHFAASNLRVAERNNNFGPFDRRDGLGFRLARTLG